MTNKGIYSRGHQSLARKLIQARRQAGLDQVEVAKLLKKSQSHISKIELGERRIEALELQALVKIYRKPITHFLK